MREKLLFDAGWWCHEGEIEREIPIDKVPYYNRAKTETALWGPGAVKYGTGEERTEYWYPVRLPHDATIAKQPEEHYNQSLGYLPYPNLWYRNHFILSNADRNKRITLYFEGTSGDATVYINGCLVHRNFCGYNPYEVDITDFVSFDGENVLAVHLDNSENEGWWYEGTGIYRHVWLIKTEQISVDLFGVWVCPQKEEHDIWSVPVETTLRNDSDSTAEITLLQTVIDANGQAVAAHTAQEALAPNQKTVIRQLLSVENPALWDTESPKLYSVHTVIAQNGNEIDSVDTTFGFRTIAFDTEKGFFLNGRRVQINGVCCHQDYGLTGKAMPDRIHRYRLELLKQMGANGYRTSHYPHAEATMQALDELGFLVMDETRWFSSTPEHLHELELLIKRDRNHPSVIMWSLANEEPLNNKEQGGRIMKRMRQFARTIDNSRPFMSAVSSRPQTASSLPFSDVIGINYNMENWDPTHAAYPDTPIVISECCASPVTRGWYYDNDNARQRQSAYDHQIFSWADTREHTAQLIAARPWVMGSYQWAGIEHRGETQWPRLCSVSGALDLYLLKKEPFYQNLSHWTKKPMIHLLPHWNLPDFVGETVKVWAYTNCDTVELFCNGVSQGKKHIELPGHGEWDVIYTPGELLAVGYQNGVEVTRERVETTGKPVALALRLETENHRSTGEDVAVFTCYCVDEQGRTVPDASPMLHFYCRGNGAILGTGSDNTDHVPPKCPDRQMYAGACSVVLSIGDRKEDVTLFVKADGLEPAKCTVKVLPAEPRPAVPSKNIV